MNITNYKPHMASNELMTQLRKEFDERVQKAVKVSKDGLTPCDLWIGTTCPAWESVEKGHGKLQTDTAKALNLNYAHHISMFLNNPEEYRKREGRVMLHACDTPHCVNIQHLKWDTQAENVADMIKAGRAKFNKSGIENTNAKLSAESLKYIIDNPTKSIKDLSTDLGLDRHTISRALDGKTGYLTAQQISEILESRKIARVDMAIIEDLNAGMTDVDIAKKHSIHRKLVPVIKQRAIEIGIEVIDHEEILMEKIVKAVAEGVKLVKIAEDFGISRSYVNTLKTRAGLKPKFNRPDCKK